MSAPTAYFSAGVAALLRHAPYYATVLAKLIRRPVDAPGVTLAVSDDGFLFYSPTYIKTLDVVELATAIEHEVSHVLFRHASRATALAVPDAARTIWNFATDCAINETLRSMQGRKIGANWLVPETFQLKPGQTAELYYQALLQKLPPQPKKGDEGASGVGAGECGSCSGGHKADIENDSNVRGNAKPRTATEMDLTRRQVAREALAHAQKARGDVPAYLVRWAEALLAPPAIDWRTRLQRRIRANASRAMGAVDLAWGTPSRRQYGVGTGPGRAVLPSYIRRVPRVAVIVDTSGSMSQADLSRAMAEVEGITKTLGAAIEFISIDATVHSVVQCASAREAMRALKGGGGTDMRPAIKLLQDRGRNARPDFVVCLTDGAIGDIGPRPSFAFLWVVIGGYAPHYKFAWGDRVDVEAV